MPKKSGKSVKNKRKTIKKKTVSPGLKIKRDSDIRHKVYSSKPASKQLSDAIKRTRVRVIGVGGGGGSIVSELALRVQKATFVVANTDAQALKSASRKAIKFQFGQSLTRGLGTGMKGDVAELASQNEKEKIKKLLQGQDLCIFVACLGGGTGSGAVPIFAKAAKNLGSISYGIFTMPFKFEGEKKMQLAMETLQKLKPNLNAISIIPNDRIFQIVNKETPLKVALSAINKHLADSLEALLETIYSPGLINIDFADLKTVFEGRGRLTYLNSVEVSDMGKNEELVKSILHSPLYPYTIKGAKGILFNIVDGKDIGLSEVSQISNVVADAVNRQAKIIMGISNSRLNQVDRKEGKVKITLLATGCGQRIFTDQLSLSKHKSRKRKKAPRRNKITTNKVVKRVKPAQKKSFKKKKVKKAIAKTPSLVLPGQSLVGGLMGPAKQEKIEIKVRRNGLDIQKSIKEEEKELISQENKWELPAFLRRKNKPEDR